MDTWFKREKDALDEIKHLIDGVEIAALTEEELLSLVKDWYRTGWCDALNNMKVHVDALYEV